MKVLVVKTSSMGDIIHSLPALTDAMQTIPGIRFDWVVEEAFAEIPRWHPAVERVIPVAIRRWRKSIWQTLRSGEWQRYREQLQATEYDAVIDAQGLLKSALLATRLAKGPRFGLDKLSAREPLAARFYDHPLNVAKQQHAVERVRQLFAQALGYSCPTERGDFSIRNHFQAVADKPPCLMFLHGTTWHDKHWPEAYWQRLIRLAADAGWHIKLPWGNEVERQRAQRLAGVSRAVEVLPRLSLAQVASELAAASGVVSVDTGLSHLAAALDRPNLVLFGPTDPGLVGGYGKDQCCLRAADYPAVPVQTDPAVFAPLTPEIVWHRLQSLLDEAGRS